MNECNRLIYNRVSLSFLYALRNAGIMEVVRLDQIMIKLFLFEWITLDWVLVDLLALVIVFISLLAS